MPTAPRLLALLALATTVAGAAPCAGSGGGGVPPGSPQPLHDLAATAAPEGFYDHPYPSDARRTANGAPDVSTFFMPAGMTVVPDVAAAVMRDIRGFSPAAGVYLRFSAALDPATLPASPAATLDPAASVYLVDVDPTSPRRGERWMAEVHFRDRAGQFWRPNTLVVRPPLGMPLPGGRRFAAVVTRAVRGAGGEAPTPNPAFTALLGASAPAGRETEWQTLSALRETLPAADLAEVLVATVFTTSNDLGDMRRVRTWLHANVPAPVATAWTLIGVDEGAGHALYTGRFEMMQLLTGEPPFKTPGQGVIALDADGDPVPGPMVSLRFALTVPLGAPPAGGWPIATYGHGAGGDYRSFVDSEGIWAAQAGVAMLSMDNPMNGERDPEGGDFERYLASLAMSNVAAGRDMYRHGIVDHVQLARLARGGLQVPAGVSHTGAAIDLDGSRLQYVGHSMGSQIGAMLIAVEPDLGAAFLSEGGGSAAAALLYRKSGGIDIEGLLAVLLDVDTDTEPLDADHPVVGLLLQTLLDPGDPLSYAYGAIREAEGPPRSIVMTEGLLDDQTLPVTIESLAAAFGLPIAEPVAQASAAHGIWSIAATTLPASGNVTLGPTPVTGALLQFPGQGHFALYHEASAQEQLRQWLATAAAGAPMVVMP